MFKGEPDYFEMAEARRLVRLERLLERCVNILRRRGVDAFVQGLLIGVRPPPDGSFLYRKRSRRFDAFLRSSDALRERCNTCNTCNTKTKSNSDVVHTACTTCTNPPKEG